MPLLRLTRVEEATGLLKEEFEAAIVRAGKVFDIVQATSLRPAVPRGSMHLHRELAADAPTTIGRHGSTRVHARCATSP